MANLPTTIGLHARLRAACEQAGIEHPGAWLARTLSVAPPTASQWLNGKVVLTADKAWVLSRLLGVSFGWLYFGEGSGDAIAGQVKDAGQTYSAAVEVPVYGSQAGAGTGVDNPQSPRIGSVLFRPRSLHRRQIAVEHARVFYVSGNSMLPRLRDGDAVLFDNTDTTPVDGKVYVLQWSGRDYVKRLRFERGSWWIYSDNTSDPEWAQPKQVRIAHDDCIVIGRVRWVGSWED
jgi:transcriptional regulator with XRE-family HTH domain